MEPIEQNVGTVDRLVRAVLALCILVFLMVRGKVSFFTAASLLVGGMLLSSATSGVCSLYTELGISTLKEEPRKT
ncbi:MAG TPA: DUF2892 domain-containing protein [Deltaproteobacteria bacterium]|jgi:hypothetical protein|nr:DUF2892 domain-containing protein [Deltaproteobacteria bacterium]OQC28712.1 MAG: hypothetical protein BWX71_00677 [Deltaproteobacteria bacterium ADurb.Bin072]HRW79928.1 DUF2892 domain-containing protein [Desulfomonilia bacterium]HNQ86226.1 DUF2892 domain-containing protein [Deltaproteobacteria bacterium]HNS90462.1 DUF2892 domain-containing protein [Deltaproteobacteria bacterium]